MPFTHGDMNQRFLSGLTATLLITTLGTTFSSRAGRTQTADQNSEANLKTVASTLPPNSSGEVVKVGEQPSPGGSAVREEVIAKIHPHVLSGRQAATLYVRDIPVLTFLGSQPSSNSDIKMGETQAVGNSSANQVKTLQVDPAQPGSGVEAAAPDAQANTDQDDPVARASALAARLNQLYREGVDANRITVAWKAEQGTIARSSDRYLIQANQQVLAIFDSNTILPDSTRNPERDALQATNRLRRLLGNAAPLQEITGKPRREQQISLGSIRLRLNGWASWYGPGFHGNPSASGEIFNQHAFTAAHRSLPFGTKVQVTNLDNGRSVIVRINDRGPFEPGRVIDLSAAAARVIGLLQSGVAPVRLEVVNDRPTAIAGN